MLADLLTRAELEGPFNEPPRRTIIHLDEVRYVSCPLCHNPMNRLNFGRVSGVIVDVCKAHGTWFDGGELTRIVAFASAGGLQKTRAREAADRASEKKERATHNTIAFIHGTPASRERVLDFSAVVQDWRELLRDLFYP